MESLIYVSVVADFPLLRDFCQPMVRGVKLFLQDKPGVGDFSKLKCIRRFSS